MRIIKSNNNAYYKSFAETLVESSPSYTTKQSQPENFMRQQKENDRRLSRFLEDLIDFDVVLHRAESLDEVIRIVKSKVNEVLDINDLAFFFFDDTYDDFVSVGNNLSQTGFEIVNIIKSDAIFEHLISQNKIVLIPISDSVKKRGGINNLLFVPVKKWKKNNYFVFIDTKIGDFNSNSFEAKALIRIFTHAIPIIENIVARKKLNKVYHDFQIYQSKFLKDYRLAAIGELTLGIAEEIISPMQVILSSLEFVSENSAHKDTEIYERISDQVRKVKAVIKRLVKFSSLTSSDIEIKPCDLNNIIQEYIGVINTTLKGNNYECILDLDKDMAPILSHPSYLSLMLSTLFSIIKGTQDSGGMILQTRNNDGKVFLKLITTDFIEALSSSTASDENSLDLLVLRNLVKKHEGKLKYQTSVQDGTKLLISFPIIRKIR